MVKITRKELEALAVAFGIADFFAEGKLSAPFGRAAKKALVKAGPAIARGIIRYAPTVALTAARVTPTPLAAAATGALVLQNRELIRDAAGNVYEKVAPAAQQYAAGVAERAMDPQTYMVPEQSSSPFTGRFAPLLPGIKPSKRVRSKYNKAVSKGMSVIKASTSYGKKGTINNAKKAFSVVTKTASAINKGGKVAKSGIKRKLGLVMRKIL